VGMSRVLILAALVAVLVVALAGAAAELIRGRRPMLLARV
jgi:hypothetical protein